MQFFNSKIKKIAAIILAIFTLFFLATAFSQAPGENKIEKYLRFIMNYTYQTLVSAESLLTVWISPDDSDSTAALQENFIQLYSNTTKSLKTQGTQNNKLTTQLFLSDSMPGADSLNYQTLLANQPEKNTLIPGKNLTESRKLREIENNKAISEYIQSSSGLNFKLSYPGSPYLKYIPPGWQGDDIEGYQHVYFTVTSIETFNAYILSQLYPNIEDRKTLTFTQNSIIEKTTSPTWFQKVATENIGWVIRQILIYQSQTYVLLTQLLETQKQLLTAQVMSNSLAIALNKQSIDALSEKARVGAPKENKES